jgi:hypothetical protein
MRYDSNAGVISEPNILSQLVSCGAKEDAFTPSTIDTMSSHLIDRFELARHFSILLFKSFINISSIFWGRK